MAGILGGGIMADPTQVPLLNNGLQTSQHGVYPLNLLNSAPTSGMPGNDIASQISAMIGYVPNPNVPNDQTDMPSAHFDGSDINREAELGKDVEDFKINSKLLVVGDTITSGQVVFKFEHIHSEGEQYVHMTHHGEEVSFSMRAIIGGNLQTANYRGIGAFLADAKARGVLGKMINKPFNPDIAMPIQEFVNVGSPIGMAGVETNWNGGESRASKLGKEGGVSGFSINGMQAAMMEILQYREGVYENIAPPRIPRGSHIFIYATPVKITNGTSYNIGGTGLYTAYKQAYPYNDQRPFSAFDERKTVWFPDVPQSSPAYIWAWQWQVAATLDFGFNPCDLCPIDWMDNEYQQALLEGEAEELIHYPGYYQHIGIITNFPTYTSTSEPAINEIGKAEMEEMSRDVTQQRLVLGDACEDGNMYMLVDFGRQGYF